MNDDEAIRKLVGEHFESMRWDTEVEPDWQRFRDDFLPEALLFGAARPVQARSVDGFVDRMETVARKNLRRSQYSVFEMQSKIVGCKKYPCYFYEPQLTSFPG